MAEVVSAAEAGKILIGDLSVNRIGLGTNRLTDTLANHALLKRALELGINFIDTAHTYAGGASETTIGNALTPYPTGLMVATKGGMGQGASASQLRAELEESLRRLKTGRIDLYQLHRVDPSTPLTDTMRTLKSFADEGLIRHIGLSEVSLEQLQQALEVTPVASVQNEYNVANRRYEDVVEFCTQHHIAFIPWFPLGGLSGGTATVETQVAAVAQRLAATPQQVALAWLLKRSPMMLPIPGTLSTEHLEDNLRAATLKLSDKDYAMLGSGGPRPEGAD